MQSGYPNIAIINPLANVASNNPHQLDHCKLSQSQHLYQSYPNPKKARLIHQAIHNINKPDIDNNNNNGDIKLSTMDINNYSSLISNQTPNCFYSSGLLEPYVNNSDIAHTNADLQRIAAVSAPNGPLSSLFLSGNNFEWPHNNLNNSNSNVFQGNSNKTQIPKQFQVNLCNYGDSIYNDLNTTNMLQDLKSRDVSFTQDYIRYINPQYSTYDPNANSGVWYKLKDELGRASCPVGSSLSSDTISGGYDFNYREMKEKRKCDVCGDVSAGFHCSAFVCEACKKFFIRSSKGDSYSKYSCTKNNNCDIVKDTRTHCQYCRFQKCLRLGMTLPGTNIAQNTDISLIPCRVCGAQSSGFHFGAITCEGCKGFFRRTINERENQKYTCRNGGSCHVNLATRNNCKSCRYKKCVSVGMSKEGSRIGRQPNAIKHMCAREISQLRALGSGGTAASSQTYSVGTSGVSFNQNSIEFSLVGSGSRCPLQADSVTSATSRLPTSATSDFYPTSSTNYHQHPHTSLSSSSPSLHHQHAGINHHLHHHFTNPHHAHLHQQPHQLHQSSSHLIPTSTHLATLSSSISSLSSTHPITVNSTNYIDSSIQKAIIADYKKEISTMTTTTIDQISSSSPPPLPPPPPPKLEYYSQPTHQLNSSSMDEYYVTNMMSTGGSNMKSVSNNGDRNRVLLNTDSHSYLHDSDTNNNNNNTTSEMVVETPTSLVTIDNPPEMVASTRHCSLDQTVSVHLPHSTASSIEISLTQSNMVGVPFSLDMPLHKFISHVNTAARNLSFCPRDITDEFMLTNGSDECFVWDVMMKQFYVHAIQVIKFAKLVPGFRNLCHNDMKVLFQEGMYPIILVQLSRDYNVVTGDYNYFNFTTHEKEIILNKFSIFNKVADHVKASSKLLKPMNIDDTTFGLLCYIELVRADSSSIYEHDKISKMQQFCINALRLYMTEIGCSRDKIEAVFLHVLPLLARMTHDHQESVMELRNTNFSLKFPNLYAEMFMID